MTKGEVLALTRFRGPERAPERLGAAQPLEQERLWAACGALKELDNHVAGDTLVPKSGEA